jgi:hypothetical protein
MLSLKSSIFPRKTGITFASDALNGRREQECGRDDEPDCHDGQQKQKIRHASPMRSPYRIIQIGPGETAGRPRRQSMMRKGGNR